ncbi:MAG TPA: hydroxyacid dehydrogenase [Tepidisphaeraceae bacterium]|jgi:phosphoglycerate dehydrogenase-like enzyme
MSSKPTVVLALPAHVAKQMFRPEQLERLSAISTLLGPIMPADTDGSFKTAVAEAVAIISGWRSPIFDKAMLDQAPQLRLIAHSAGSVKTFVGDAVYDRGIRVTTAAGGNAYPVAQFTLATIISLLKQTPWIAPAYARGDQDEFLRRKGLCRELQDLDVGVISASRVGREVIKLLLACPRLRIKCFDPHLKDEHAKALGVIKVTLEEACRCEVVTIHAPSLPETRHMFNAKTLSLLPDHAVLVNTSRGTLIDESALVAELKRRQLYVALDVTDPEPPAPDSPLRTAPNLVLTPHIAGALRQGRLDMGQIAIEETLRFLKGEPLQHEVTRAMLPTQA